VTIAREHRSRPALQWAVRLTVVAIGLVTVGVGVAAPKRAVRKQMAAPIRISIPAIRVNAPIIPLGLNRDQTMQVPRRLGDAGWFRPGPEPGEQGAAVVVGHLNAGSARGVFANLRGVRRGDVIKIRRKDGTLVRFVARSMIRVPKNRFPTARVYARTKQPTLRVITCAGAWNPVSRRHPDNYIIFATIVRSR
jgi:sortase (surface protein transpeptidase)